MAKKNFTRKDLSNNEHFNLGFSKNISDEITENFFNCLVDKLINSKKVKLSSFGVFNVKKKRERIGRNPKTKVSAKISARKVINFKASILFKNKINNL